MLVVYGYLPAEGEAEALITVDAEMRTGGSLDPGDPVVPNGDTQQLQLRLVLGRTALKTRIKDSTPREDTGYGGRMTRVLNVRLFAQVPPYADTRYPESTAVPLTLQLLYPNGEVCDMVTFGTFTYWESR